MSTRVIIREADFYGGDLWLELDEPAEYDSHFVTHPARIVWEAWGEHGGASIQLTADEATRVADALKAAPWREAVPSNKERGA